SSQHPDIGEIAITSPEIEPVTDHKFVLYLETNIICFDLPGALFLFAQQHTGANTLWLCRSQCFANRRERVTAIENIIQDQNILIRDLGERDLSATGRTRFGDFESDLAAGLRLSVIAGHAEAIQLQGKRNSAKQVSDKHQTPVQHCDHG